MIAKINRNVDYSIASPSANAGKFNRNTNTSYTPTGGERIGYGAAGLGLGIAQGVSSAVEGITDFLAGGALQLVGQKKAAKQIYKNSWSGNFRKWIEDEINPDDNKAFSTYLDITSVVGNAGFQVGLAALTGGSSAALGASQAATKVASLAPIFMSGAGSGTSEAVQTTGKLGAKENVYGLASGTLEVVMEKALGSTGKLLGKAGIFGDAEKQAVKEISKHAVLKGIASNAGSEFMEEAATEAANTYLKRITQVDPNAKIDTGDLIRAGVYGAIAGGVLGGTSSAYSVHAINNAGRRIITDGNEKATLAEAKALIAAAKKTTDKGFLDMDAIARVDKAIELYDKDTNMPESRRAYYLGQMAEGLNAVGTYASAHQYAVSAAETVAKGGDEAKALIDGANAFFEENLGRKLTAEDFKDSKSLGSRMLASVSVFESLLQPTDAELIDSKIREDAAVAYNEAALRADAEQMSAGNGTALYRLPDGNYAVVTKRGGDGAFSVGLMKKGEGAQIYTPMHGLATVDNVVEAIGKLQSGTVTVAPSVATPKAPAAHETKAEPKKPEAPASTDSVTQKKENVKPEASNKARTAMSEGSETNKPETKPETKKQKEPKKPEPKKPENSNVQKSEKDADKEQKKETPIFAYTDRQINSNLRKFATSVYKNVAKADKGKGTVSAYREAVEIDGKYYITDVVASIILDKKSEYMMPSSVEYTNEKKPTDPLPDFKKIFSGIIEGAEKSTASAGEFLWAMHDNKSNLNASFIDKAYFDTKQIIRVASAIKNPEFYIAPYLKKFNALVIKGEGATGVVMPLTGGPRNGTVDFRAGKEPNYGGVSRSVGTSQESVNGADKVEMAEVNATKTATKTVEVESDASVEDRLRIRIYDGATFDAKDISAARADYKHFDALPDEQRKAILIMRRSAAEAKIPAEKVKGLTRLMGAFGFRAVFSPQINSNGFWVHGKNLTVVNPNEIYQSTFGHELSHRVEDYAGYDEFAAKVEKLVGKKAMEAAKAQYLADYNAAAEVYGWEKWDAEKNAEDLRREAVANTIGKYLANANYIEKLAYADKGFIYRAYRAIARMRSDIAVANKIASESELSRFSEYRTIRRMEKVFENSLGMTVKQGDTLVGMERGDGVSYNLASYKKKMIRTEDKAGNVTMRSGREILADMLKKNPAMSESDVETALGQIDKVASELEKFGTAFDNFMKWSNASVEYNLDSGELVLTSLVKNGEYEMNIDFSTICKKRVAFTNVLNAIVRSGKDIHLTPTKIAHINTVLAEHGFETACKMCFVESKRNNLQAWAKNFVNGKGGKNAQKGWNALVKAINPNATPFALVKEKTEVSDEDVLDLDFSLRSDIATNTEVLDAVIRARVDAEKKDNTESKIAKLLKEHPEYAHTLEKEDLFGSEGVTALKSKYPEIYSILLSSYGVATPKITLPAAPYASELAVANEVQKHATKKQSISDYTLSIGGVRVQSFSDYMVLRFFDYVQMIADGAAQGMAMQSYTKEISYAYLFGKTGMKINLSIVPRVDEATVKKYGKDYAGLIAREDGTFDYAFAKESIQLEDKMVNGRLVKGAFSLINEEGYRGNVGTILIGVSRQHILKALADPRISMVIPYHKSGLNKTMASLYGIADFVDYTNVQNTRNADGDKFKKDPFNFYESYRKHNGDSKKVADEYLAFCDENGYLPKFDEFRNDPNYYKLLIDFTSDYTDASGKRHIVQQGAVKLNLPDDWMDVVKADLGVEQQTSDKLDAEMDGIIEEVMSTDITNAQAAQRQRRLDDDISRSVGGTSNKKIAIGMNDDERYAILKDKQIEAPFYEGEADTLIVEEIDSKKHKYAKDAIVAIAEKLGILEEEINFKDVEVDIKISRRNIGESVSKQATPIQIAKLLPILSDVARASVLTERHTNRYYHDTDTIFFDNLLGAYVDGDDIVPIRFGLKHSRTGATTLYVVVDQNKIDRNDLTEIKKTRVIKKARSGSSPGFSVLRRRVNYSLAQVVEFVNSKDLLKYLPDNMLNEQQIATKRIGIAESVAHKNDKNDRHYTNAIARGDSRTVDRLVEAAAKDHGYTYKGYHGTNAKRFTVFKRGIAGIYLSTNKQLAEDFATNFKGETGTVYDLYARITNPLVVDEHTKSSVPYYYNIPTPTIMKAAGIKDATVSTEEIAHFAEEHNYDGVIIKGIREGTGVFTDDIIVFDPTQVKSADPVTYDDDGVEIPLSERFKAEDDDIRRSVTATPTANAVESRILFGTPAGQQSAKERVKGAMDSVVDLLTKKERRHDFVESLREGMDTFSIYFSNSFAAVETQLRRMAKDGEWDGSYSRMTRQRAQAYAQYVRTAEAKALGMLTMGQFKADGTAYEKGGEALLQILEPVLATKGETFEAVDESGNIVTVKAKGGELGGEKYRRISGYLATLNALERAAQGKNPFDSISEAELQGIVAEYEKNNPEFKEIAEKWSQFNKNLLQYRVDTGLMSQDTADQLHAMYPHYIPMYKPSIELLNGTAPVRGKSSLEINNNVKRAKGGDHLVDDPIANYCNTIVQTVKAAHANQLMNELYATADGKHVITDTALAEIGETVNQTAESYIEDPDSNPDAVSVLTALTTKAAEGLTNTLYFYKDGERRAMKVSKDIFLGLQSMNKSDFSCRGAWMLNGMAAINSGYKRLITSLNPFFSPKNVVRDLADGLLHSRFKMRQFIGAYIRMGRLMASGKLAEDSRWKEFVANGGLQSALFDRNDSRLTKRSRRTGLQSGEGLVGSSFQVIENANTLLEALPRFAEYVLSRENGMDVMDAINNSAEVTTNFARSGIAGGFLNKTIMPFLNPSIQGFSKPIRNVIENASAKSMLALLIRAALLGVVPMVLNDLMYNDDDDYTDLDDSVKENNFLFKVGDQFVKIPRGRVVSVVSGAYNRTASQMRGDYVDWKDYFENVKSQATPMDSITRTIFSPFKDVSTNTTWYGGKIENEGMQNLAPEDRYDEYTSSLAIALGKVTGKAFDVSPKKVHYLLDQYSGILGDIILPMTTTGTRTTLVGSNFTADPNTNSNLSDRFYAAYNKAMYAKNKGDEAALYEYKRLAETKQLASEMYKQISDINKRTDLSKAEKREQSAILRATINQLYKTALKDRNAYTSAVEAALPIAKLYTVEEITDKNRKALGAEKDDVGKYAVVYDGETKVSIYDTRDDAREYIASATQKTVYAEANRLVYGSEYALKEYNSSLYAKSNTIARLGVSADDYYNFYMTARYWSGSEKKEQIEKYCKENGFSKTETAILMYFSGYSSYRDEVKRIAKKSGFSKSEINDL